MSIPLPLYTHYSCLCTCTYSHLIHCSSTTHLHVYAYVHVFAVFLQAACDHAISSFSSRLWQDLGYLIIYITSRPDIQKEYVTSWLGLHGFPMGVVSFSDSLSTDPNNIKLVYLARLIKEVR